MQNTIHSRQYDELAMRDCERFWMRSDWIPGFEKKTPNAISEERSNDRVTKFDENWWDCAKTQYEKITIGKTNLKIWNEVKKFVYYTMPPDTVKKQLSFPINQSSIDRDPFSNVCLIMEWPHFTREFARPDKERER